jgi:hypothetical protein
MDLDLIRVPPGTVGGRERLDKADDIGRPEEELVAIGRAAQQLLDVRNRLMGYALTGGTWPALN